MISQDQANHFFNDVLSSYGKSSEVIMHSLTGTI